MKTYVIAFLVGFLVMSLFIIISQQNEIRRTGQEGRELEMTKITKEFQTDYNNNDKLVNCLNDLEFLKAEQKRIVGGCVDKVYGNCLLIVTNGSKPNSEKWSSEIFPIRTLNTKSSQISGEEIGIWNYWVTCKKEYYLWR